MNLNKEIKRYRNYQCEGRRATDEVIGDNVSLFWWGNDMAEKNLGDYLSYVVVNHVMPKSGTGGTEKTLYAIGSILGMRVQEAVVWGSGFLENTDRALAKAHCSNLDVRAVRGPKTYQQLRRIGVKCPKIFGDPALLMPQIYQPRSTKKIYDIAIIPPHWGGISVPKNDLKCVYLSMATTDYEGVIDTIVSSKRVISGSLHGIILAEAYGVPAILLLDKGCNEFKYRDYYYGTGRYNVVIARNFEEAVKLTPMTLPKVDRIANRLLCAFPRDLWDKAR